MARRGVRRAIVVSFVRMSFTAAYRRPIAPGRRSTDRTSAASRSSIDKLHGTCHVMYRFCRVLERGSRSLAGRPGYRSVSAVPKPEYAAVTGRTGRQGRIDESPETPNRDFYGVIPFRPSQRHLRATASDERCYDRKSDLGNGDRPDLVVLTRRRRGRTCRRQSLVDNPLSRKQYPKVVLRPPPIGISTADRRRPVTQRSGWRGAITLIVL